jgi:NAD+ kinase
VSARVALVLKRTTYRKFVLDDHDPRLAKLVAKRDPTVRKLKQSHDAHEESVREVEEALDELGATIAYRGGTKGKIPPRIDLVVTVGGDGTLLNASHQIGSRVPLLGINSSPEHSIGFFCGGTKGRAKKALRGALDGTTKRVELTRMRVDKNGKLLHARVLNEALFCHASPAATSRYLVGLSGVSVPVREEEDHRSSGVWIGPAAGSTAAQRSAGGNVLPIESSDLQYVVREPYMPAGTVFRHVVGRVRPDERFTVRSKMREAKLFLDGHAREYDVTIGDVLVFRRSEQTLTVVGLDKAARRRWEAAVRLARRPPR